MTDPADHVTVARIGKAHGVKGEVLLLPGSVDLSLFASGAVFDTAEGALRIDAVRRHHKALIVRLEGVGDRTAAEALRGLGLSLPATDVRLGPDEWWPSDLIGMKVASVGGDPVGIVSGVEFGSSQDRLVISADGATFELPFVDALVPEVDMDRGVVIVELPEGLLDGSDGPPAV